MEINLRVKQKPERKKLGPNSIYVIYCVIGATVGAILGIAMSSLPVGVGVGTAVGVTLGAGQKRRQG